MNDFLDCCQVARVPRCDLETARTQRDALKSALADVLRQRDDARLEADRLRGEVARLAKERDEAVDRLTRVGMIVGRMLGALDG